MEVLLTVAILGGSLGLAGLAIRGKGVEAREDALRMQLELARAAVARFSMDMGCAPTALADLRAPGANCITGGGASRAADPLRWRGPYLASIEPDAVSGQPLAYNGAESGGMVSSSASGNDSRGAPFASY
jgi:type II secretory pathway pseudopilin PulG